MSGTAALVTGGGSGIGLGVARRLAADGASVTVMGRTPATLDAAVAELREVAAGGAAISASAGDVTVEADVKAAVAAACEATGGLDVLVACAGGAESIGPLPSIDVDVFRRVVDLNVVGTFLSLKHAVQPMIRAGHGSVVVIGSIASDVTHRYYGAYGVSKAALDHLVRLAADELGPSNVRVNGVRPGLTRTGLVDAVFATPELLADYERCTPLPRTGEVDDVAGLVRFLAGPESSFVTGQLINVDGGHGLRRGPDISPVIAPLFGEAGMSGLIADGPT